MDNPRAAKLSKLFHSIVTGTEPLTAQNNPLFVESISSSPDPAGCVHAIIDNAKGLQALRKSLTLDTSIAFLNKSAAKLLHAFTSPDIAAINGGSYIQNLVECIIQPPATFWDAFLRAFQANQLEPDAQESFAWLLLQLVLLPIKKARPFDKLAKNPSIINSLLDSRRSGVRSIAAKINHLVNHSGSTPRSEFLNGPGGRHDNDHIDFRQISILPTADELEFTSEKAFIRPSSWLEDPATEKHRLATHLDNQFRLLREDMVAELREEAQIALGKKNGKHRGFVINGLLLKDIYFKKSGVEMNTRTAGGGRNNGENRENREKDYHWTPWALTFECISDFWQFKKCKDAKAREAHLKQNPNFLRHQSLTCLIADGEIVAFPSIMRDEKLLAERRPVLVLRFDNSKQGVTSALMRVPKAKHVKLIHIDTAVFAYEPILTSLQLKRSMPLEKEILFFKEGMTIGPPAHQQEAIVAAIKAAPAQNLQHLLGTPQSIRLDPAQAIALTNALSQKVALIQGPPGTGKSFLGALCAKIILESRFSRIGRSLTLSHAKILVNCYTNHALDQFLEDLINIGIPEDEIVRIGGKPNQRTAELSLHSLGRSSDHSRDDWNKIESLRRRREHLSKSLHRAYCAATARHKQIMRYLEAHHKEYVAAFRIPESTDGTKIVGKGGRAIGPNYLLDRWLKGQDAGCFKGESHIQASRDIWKMGHTTRLSQADIWKREVVKKGIVDMLDIGKKYNQCVKDLEFMHRKGEASVLRTRRIIGCTTTGAAMYRDQIAAARPTVLLVEEAGEILESHIMTALSDTIEQVILIGDHQQLRPKVNNYDLTVEKGDGFDLNRSLFERLVLQGYPHTRLKVQHRMRPEISALIRHLTYPDLIDATKTTKRASVHGLQNNLVLINHDQLETEVVAEERKDMSAKSSKQNHFEVQMVLKIVRYLGQQGYGADRLVILTPYLGQLRAIMDALKEAQDSDAVLSDLDSHDLVRAGLRSESDAKAAKKQIRLATIDNYQGEESDIVIASLTRSNHNRDIGFMSSPERLNVLLSRARDGLIMIGNIQTFTTARRGGELWTKLVEHLKEHGNIYDGLPVFCEQHPDRRSLLKTPANFDTDCPDGGCNRPCRALLSCTMHYCPLSCHQHSDHSQVHCDFLLHTSCANGHSRKWKCHDGPPATCERCDRDQKAAKKAAERAKAEEVKLLEQKEAEKRQFLQEVAQLNEQLAKVKGAQKDHTPPIP